LDELGSRGVRCHKKRAVGHGFRRVYDFLLVEATPIDLKHLLKDSFVYFCLGLSNFATLAERRPNLVRLFEGHHFLVFFALSEAQRAQTFDHHNDLDTVATPEKGENVFELALNDDVQIAVAVLERLENVVLRDQAE